MRPRFSASLLLLLCSVLPAAAQLRPARIMILIGPPGSGKSVQAKQLSKRYKIPTVSMAALLRQEIGKKTPVARALASSLASGELVNDDAANELVKARLLRSDTGQGFILDGYPTTAGQAKALDQFLSEHAFPKPMVVVIDAPDAVVRSRMSSRGRADDAPENIERRIREYRDVGAFTEKWYGPENTVRVDGTGTIQSVALAIERQMDAARTSRGLLVRTPDESGLRQRPPVDAPKQ
ncbi:MAG TPA: nucleoside monophosphate kinase [Bryobacteraceae bacterium]|nr:nucleoside monophosphate kinase [Bryobacteraceae bacterium]